VTSLLNSAQIQLLNLAEPFKSLGNTSLTLVTQYCEIITLPAHSTLFTEGELSDSLYIIESGQITIYRSDKNNIITINSTGDTVGSLTLNRSSHRSASAYTLTPSSLIKFSKQSFEQLKQRAPEIAFEIKQALIQRTHHLYLGLVMRTNPMLAQLTPEILAYIEAISTIQHVKNGDILWKQGDFADYFYIVITGRLRIWQSSVSTINSGLKKEIAPGETVGELGTITNAPRKASLRALRDSTLAKITRDQLTDLLTHYPAEINTMLVKTVSYQLSTPQRGHHHAKNASNTIALIPINADIDVNEIGQQLNTALAVSDKTLIINSISCNALLGIPGFSQLPLDSIQNSNFLNWLNDLEFKHQHILLIADNHYSNWTRRCVHQADHLLFVANSHTSPDLGELEKEVLEKEKHLGIRKSLLLIHKETTTVPKNTRAWLAARRIGMHYHLRQHNNDDFARLARFLTGRSVGLVLGGGAARGFAHIGVLRALQEHKIPVDLMGGTSMGALIAAQYAMQKDLNSIITDTLKLCLSGDRLTIPLVSLYEGFKMRNGLHQFFGDFSIEDLWCRFYSVSCNLSRAKVMVHDKGSLLDAVTASNIPPGLFPPQVVDGDLLVDGALLNNVPIDIMTRYNEGGTLIAVDVNPKDDLLANTTYEGGLSGWKVLQSKISPFKNKMQIPSIIDVLMRSTAIGGLAQQKNMMTGRADLYLHPPVAKYPLLAYKNAEAIVESSYHYTLEQITQWQSQNNTAQP